jgi:hypothetical protein
MVACEGGGGLLAFEQDLMSPQGYYLVVKPHDSIKIRM